MIEKFNKYNWDSFMEYEYLWNRIRKNEFNDKKYDNFEK